MGGFYYNIIYTYIHINIHDRYYYNLDLLKQGVQSWMKCPQILVAVNLYNWWLRWPLQPKLWPWALLWLENHEWVQGCGITYRVLVAGGGQPGGCEVFLGCWFGVGGFEDFLRFFLGAAGECGFRKVDWWFPNSCRVSSCAQRINNQNPCRQSKMKNPHEVFPIRTATRPTSISQ